MSANSWNVFHLLFCLQLFKLNTNPECFMHPKCCDLETPDLSKTHTPIFFFFFTLTKNDLECDISFLKNNSNISGTLGYLLNVARASGIST